MRFVPIGIAAVLACALGCAEAPPPVPAVPVASAEPAPAPKVAVDLAPVTEPSDIFVVARWKNPNATLSGIASCAGVPVEIAETTARKLVDSAMSNAFRGGVDGRAIADAVALDASLDLVVAIDPASRGTPNALFAFSVPLTAFDRVRGALEARGPLDEVAPGLYRVGTKDAGDLTCVAGPAAGPAPARLVCGQRDKDVVALGPYLARNLSVAPLPDKDLHAELRFVPIDTRYGATIRRGLGLLPNFARMQTIGDPRYDRALEEAAQALADEGAALAGDLDRATIDLSVDGASCLTATTALQLRGKSSWLAGTIASSGDRAGSPPAIFWRAPGDADSASYGHGTDVSRYTGIFRALRALLEGQLAKNNIGTEADRKALAALVDLPLSKDTNVVVASGHTHNATKQIPAGAKLDDQQMVDELTNAYLGWYVLGFDEKPDAIAKLLKDVVGVYNRKSLHDELRARLGRDGDALPTARVVAAPKELGRGALAIALEFAIKKPGAAPVDPSQKATKKGKGKDDVTFAVHILLMPDGKNTWLGIGASREDVVKHLLASKSGAPESGTLAARPGLEPLRSGKAVSSGFISIAMFTRGIAAMLNTPLIAGRGGSALADFGNTLNNLPHHGTTPIFLTSNATGTGPRSEFVINMQKGSFEDLGTIVIQGLRIAKGAGLLPGVRP
jgi:hypothetical protein